MPVDTRAGQHLPSKNSFCGRKQPLRRAVLTTFQIIVVESLRDHRQNVPRGGGVQTNPSSSPERFRHRPHELIDDPAFEWAGRALSIGTHAPACDRYGMQEFSGQWHGGWRDSVALSNQAQVIGAGFREGEDRLLSPYCLPRRVGQTRQG
jgi:hypothetical protein